MDEICFLPATTQARMIRERQISAVELTQTHLDQIARVNPAINAIVTLVPERALAQAAAADAALLRGDVVGPLHGLPVAHKDLAETAEVRTTFGSLLYTDHVPTHDCLLVERIRAAGAITLGKTNTPEFGAGSHTFNALFGATHNPYDLAKSAGGSSGGAAAALACGMVALADGSDMGGSLRNPAAFCNVVGLRPGPGRVPDWPSQTHWSPLATDGPLARTVSDVALFLSVIAGADLRAPLSLAEDPTVFARPLAGDVRGWRVAWSPTLGGLPFDPHILAALAPHRATFADLGCTVTDEDLDLRGAVEVFTTWRAWHFAVGLGPLIDKHPGALKATIVGNIAAGRALTGEDLARAERLRAQLWQRVLQFFTRYDALVCPVTQVPPFVIAQEYVTEIAGVPMQSYIDWMQSCTVISATGLPAISVPAGFTAAGLPVGIQIIGRPRGERALLELAFAFEQATMVGARRPPDR